MTVQELRAEFQVSASPFFRGTAKPYVRWWWLAGPFTQQDITRQLQWVRDSGFGGVELAWICPSWLEEDPDMRPPWLGREWTELLLFTKTSADELLLGCDFTFGSCWPFGGSWLLPEDAAQTLNGPSEQRLECSWERAEAAPVLNHLSSAALGRYAQPLLSAMRAALTGSMSALFCDSLELRTEAMWSPELWHAFTRRFGYSLEPLTAELSQNHHVRYDYRKLISETILREFYQSFRELCQLNGCYARVQCHGAPTDLLAAYAAVDVPESESLLFPPAFARIPASAAAWAGQPIVSAEAFTCIYGFPGWDDSAELYWRQENIADLKLLADSLFAHGVNQLVWHGMPYQPAGRALEFYASVHVGPDSAWSSQLPAFNAYIERVSAVMQLGRPYGGIGVYLPFEDALMQDRLADKERTPGANYHWEMRHAVPPKAVEGFHPLWVSEPFLHEARVENGLICSRELTLSSLFLDCEWVDVEALTELARLAEAGAAIICARNPKQPGHLRKDAEYESKLSVLLSLASSSTSVLQVDPLLTGENLPWYWARVLGQDLLLFFAHPAAKHIHYPMQFGLGGSATKEERELVLNWRGRKSILNLRFEPQESLLMLIRENGAFEYVQLDDYRPGTPLSASPEKHVVNDQH